MRKILVWVLLLAMALMLVGCGKSSDDKKDDSKKEEEKKDDNKKDDKKDDDKKDDIVSGGSDVIVRVLGEQVELAAGSQARDSWHAVTTLRNYEFDASGKCLLCQDIYFLDDAANYDLANQHLTGADWKPQWSADKTNFMLENTHIDYTDPEDALEYFDSRYYAYTITYADKSTKAVEAPNLATKLANIKAVYGINFTDVQGLVGEYEVVTWYRENLSIKMNEKATLEQMNALGAKLFEICKPLAEDGKMYTYLGKYGDELTAAPVADSIFDTSEFHYFCNGKEIKVSVGISQKLNEALTLYVGVVK